MRPRSLTVPDARGRATSLRVTRHPSQRKVVISHWRYDVCIASTPIDRRELPALIGVLVEALGDVDNSAESASATTSRARPLEKIQRWLRPKPAQIIAIRQPPDENNDISQPEDFT
jgi:hypothetical protein